MVYTIALYVGLNIFKKTPAKYRNREVIHFGTHSWLSANLWQPIVMHTQIISVNSTPHIFLYCTWRNHVGIGKRPWCVLGDRVAFALTKSKLSRSIV